MSFRHDTKLAEKVERALFVPDEEEWGEGVLLKPMAASKTVKRFSGTPFTVYFDGGCPVKTGIGSIGMHFVDCDEQVLLTRGEHDVGFTSNHSEFLGLFRAL